jgi:hypothetical protein
MSLASELLGIVAVEVKRRRAQSTPD